MTTTQARGIDLTPEDQAHVLRAYIHRFTREHRPQWADRPDCQNCPVQFASDRDWLENTWFAVRMDGRLDNRVSFCESRPTFPDNPELRRPHATVATLASA